MAKIIFANKEDNQVSPLDEKYKVTADNMNEIKASVNALYDMLASPSTPIISPIVIDITSANFSGSNYTNSNLVDLTSNQFLLITNGGSGVVLKEGDGFTFASAIGRITTDPEDYKLIIFKPITVA